MISNKFKVGKYIKVIRNARRLFKKLLMFSNSSVNLEDYVKICEVKNKKLFV